MGLKNKRNMVEIVEPDTIENMIEEALNKHIVEFSKHQKVDITENLASGQSLVKYQDGEIWDELWIKWEVHGYENDTTLLGFDRLQLDMMVWDVVDDGVTGKS